MIFGLQGNPSVTNNFANVINFPGEGTYNMDNIPIVYNNSKEKLEYVLSSLYKISDNIKFSYIITENMSNTITLDKYLSTQNFPNNTKSQDINIEHTRLITILFQVI